MNADCDICGKFFPEDTLERCDTCQLVCCEDCIEEDCENDHEYDDDE